MFTSSMLLKMFYNKCEFIFVIPSNGIYGIDSRKNKLGYGGDLTSVNVSPENKFE